MPVAAGVPSQFPHLRTDQGTGRVRMSTAARIKLKTTESPDAKPLVPRAAWDMRAHQALVAPEDSMRFVSRVFHHALGAEPGAAHPKGLPFLAAKVAACPPGMREHEGALAQARSLGLKTGHWHDYDAGQMPPKGSIVFFPATAENLNQGRVALSLGEGRMRCSRAEPGGVPQVRDWDITALSAAEGADPTGWYLPGKARKEPRQVPPEAQLRAVPSSSKLLKQPSTSTRSALKATTSSVALHGLKAPQGRLQRGMTGDAVEQLQRVLVGLGFLASAQMKAGSGVFGPQTQEALVRFQESQGIVGTGIYGPNTRAALVRVLGEK